jgi:hypothetical protein
MLYDPLSQRWFATVSGTSDPDSFLAVSTSSDPMQAWKGAKLPLPRIDPGVKIGVDRNGLYICSANGSSDMREASNCFVIPKADAIAPEGPALSRAQTFPKLISPTPELARPPLFHAEHLSDVTISPSAKLGHRTRDPHMRLASTPPPSSSSRAAGS